MGGGLGVVETEKCPLRASRRVPVRDCGSTFRKQSLGRTGGPGVGADPGRTSNQISALLRKW